MFTNWAFIIWNKCKHVDNDADGGGGDDNDNSIQHIQSLQYLAHTLYARSCAKSIYIGTHVTLSHIVVFQGHTNIV